MKNQNLLYCQATDHVYRTTKRILKLIELISEFNMATNMKSILKNKFYFYSLATNTGK